MWCSLFQRCQKQNDRNFNFRGYKGPRKLKTANINPYVFGANPRKFGDEKIFHFTVNRLLKLQKRAARIILQADFMTPSKEMFQELGWLTYTQRVQHHICVMVFKSLNGQAPEYLSNLLTKCLETNVRSLRSSKQETLKVPLHGLHIMNFSHRSKTLEFSTDTNKTIIKPDHIQTVCQIFQFK